MEWIRERPWLLAIPIVGVIIYLITRQRTETVFVPVSAEQPAQVMPGPTGEGFDLAAMQEVLAQQSEAIAGLMAAQTVAMREMLTEQSAMVSAQTQEIVEEVKKVYTKLPTAASENLREYETSTTSTTQAAFSPITKTIPWYYGGATVGEKTVTAKSPYELGILQAKEAYWKAQAAGDVAGMEAAHREAERIREQAKKAGVQLAEWAATASGK